MLYCQHRRTLISRPQLRLDESNLIFRGTEDEASSVVLKGTLVLCLAEPLRIQGIRLRLTGERKLGSGSMHQSIYKLPVDRR